MDQQHFTWPWSRKTSWDGAVGCLLLCVAFGGIGEHGPPLGLLLLSFEIWCRTNAAAGRLWRIESFFIRPLGRYGMAGDCTPAPAVDGTLLSDVGTLAV
jgi:hypothetical protein